MTALVATVAAALYGGADFLGGFASRRAPALAVTIASQTVGFCALVAASVLAPPVSWADPVHAWGLIAGVFGGTGVLALYAGLATGRMSLVAPVTAALSGSIPALWGTVVAGEPLTVYARTGIGLALCAVVIVSATVEDDGSGSGRRAVLLGVVAGVGFAGAILSYARTGAESGLVPLALARVACVVLLGSVALFRRRNVALSRAAVPLVVATGIADAAANIAQVVAVRLGPLAIASVIGALYPVGTLVLARVVLHERLHGWQRAGIALALAAVVLTAIP